MNAPMNFAPRLLAAAALLLCAAPVSRAQVNASISSQTGQVGVPLQLQYQFVNVGRPADMPRSLMVDGLEIRLTGKSQRTEIVNMQASSMAIFSYTVIPNRPGNFTIPGFAVQADGRQLRTPAVSLRVAGGGGAMPPPPGPGVQQMLPPPMQQRQPQQQQQRPPRQTQPQQIQPGRTVPRTDNGEPAPYFGEIVIGDKSVYVGEVVPVELRFYFRADCQFDNLQRPTFGGDGFTAAPLSEPEQTEQYVEDIPYNIVTFRSAVTPAKSGELEIPPAMMEGRMVAAGGPAGLDPFFDQFFQNFPMPGFGRAENIQASTDRTRLDVQALPQDGRPENFSGAVGQFTMKASADPKSVDAGEPVTLTLKVEGRGSFDAMTPPELTGADGWRTYAPKESFDGNDAIGFGGTKTFEYSMVAREDRSATPGASFSYFDPLKKKYVTLTSDPVAVTAAGGGSAADDAQTAAATDADLPPTQGAPDDIATPANALSSRTPDFRPWIVSDWFRLLNFAVLAALIISIPYLLWMRKRAKKDARTIELEGAVRTAKASWQKATDPVEFYAAAGQFVLARLALLDNKPAALIDPEEALARRVSDPAERRELQSVLAKRDELNYGRTGGGQLDEQERRRVVDLLDKFAKNHA
jgi:hypothetical protein